jgi:acyl-coenzyme A synthetase/AMP-(fatty) acid ligase
MQRLHPLTTREPGEVIAHGPSGAITVGEFLAHATGLAEALPPRQFIINLSADRYTFLLGFCAAVIAGQCTLMPPNRQRQTLQQLAEAHADCYTFGEAGVEDIEHVDSTDLAAARTSMTSGVPEIDEQHLCAIVFTSGSTGTPTPNRKYWKTLRTGSLSNVDLLMSDEQTQLNLLATVPPQHMWGFETSILLPLFCNVAVSHLTPFFPQDISDALASLPEPRALVSSPVHLDAFLNARTEPQRINRIFSATAPMSEQLARDLEERFSAQVVEVFGSSESGIIARRNTADEKLWQLAPAFRLEAGEDGLLVSAAHLPEGLLLQDSIELVGDTHFRWLGRHQDMVNIAGKRGSLADLNHRLNAIPGVIDGVIFLPDESSKRLAALVVAPELEPSDILKRLRPVIEPAFLPRPVYIVASLPRQETGKLARKMLVQQFAEIKRRKTLESDDLADNTA